MDSIPSSFCYLNENSETVDNTHKDKAIEFSVEVEDGDLMKIKIKIHYMNTGTLKVKR